MRRAHESDSGRQLFPLIRSIALEILERGTELRRIERRLAELSPVEEGTRRKRLLAIAEMAAHTRGMLRTRRELHRLGCAVVGTKPLTLHVPAGDGKEGERLLWRIEDPA